MPALIFWQNWISGFVKLNGKCRMKRPHQWSQHLGAPASSTQKSRQMYNSGRKCKYIFYFTAIKKLKVSQIWTTTVCFYRKSRLSVNKRLLHLDSRGDALWTFPCTHPHPPNSDPVSTLHAAQLSANQFGSKSSSAWKTLVHTAIQATEYELTRRVKNKVFLCVKTKYNCPPQNYTHASGRTKRPRHISTVYRPSKDAITLGNSDGSVLWPSKYDG